MGDFGDFINHLEFLGYDVSDNDERLRVTHAQNLNFSLKKFRGGVLITTFFGGSEYGKNNRGSFLALVNKLNQGAVVARYYVDSDGDMVIEGYCPGEYNKKTFSAFLDAFNFEKSNLSENSDEIAECIE